MTTHIAILGAVPLKELFEHGRTLLGADDSITWEDKEHFSDPGARSIFNNLGQGLPGIWNIAYRPDAPLRMEAHRCEWDEANERYRCAPEGQEFCGLTNGPACALEASIDTAYSYKTDSGAWCGDLHAWFITEIAAWCAQRGADARWYAGEVSSELWEYEPMSAIGKLGDADLGRLDHAVAQ